MKYVIDTSSLLALVRYYTSIDSSGDLKKILKEKYETRELIVIDKVFQQCLNIQSGVIVSELPFLKNKSYHVKTVNILPTAIFFTLLNKEFLNQALIKKITSVALDLSKNRYLNDADGKLLIYCDSISSENPTIVTEESKTANDGKHILKIPLNCIHLNIPCITLPELLKKWNISLFDKP